MIFSTIFFRWTRNNWKRAIAFAIVIILLLPIVVHILFTIPNFWTPLLAKWNASDILNNYASILTISCKQNLLSSSQ